MCDYSLETVQSRAAKVDDMLVVTNFGTGTAGFSALNDRSTAVCLRPGTELALAHGVSIQFPPATLFCGPCVAIFRKINGNNIGHHDALEFPLTGEIILLTRLAPGTQARVLQLPVEEPVPEEKPAPAPAPPIPAPPAPAPENTIVNFYQRVA